MKEHAITKSVIITGAGSGIGRALSRYFAELRWAVCAVDVNRKAAERTTREIATWNPLSFAREVDIRDQRAVCDVYSACVEKFGGVTAIVNNAGITDKEHHRLLDLPLKVWQQILSVNLTGTFVSLTEYAKHMVKQQKGNIINVTSLLGQAGQTRLGDAPYGVSKAGIEAFTKFAAEELKDFGINVNSVYPAAMVDTEFFNYLAPEERDKLERPSILNEVVYVLSNLEPGELTGVSVCAKTWRREYRLAKLAEKYLNISKLLNQESVYE